MLFDLLLTVIIIADPAESTSDNVAQNAGTVFVQSASHFSIDKNAEVWYNGKLRHGPAFCQEVLIKKEED